MTNISKKSYLFYQKSKYSYMVKLSELKQNQSGKIMRIFGNIKTKKRLLQLGFTTGQIIKVLSISSLKKSFLVSIRSYTLAINRKSLDFVEVEMI